MIEAPLLAHLLEEPGLERDLARVVAVGVLAERANGFERRHV